MRTIAILNLKGGVGKTVTAVNLSYPKMEHGEDITVHTQLPYCYGMGYGTAERLVKAADALGCSLDYLFCRTDDPKGGVD